MIVINKDCAPYKPEYVGMICYHAYWQTYCLVLAVDDNWVTELDRFGGGAEDHCTRRHCTALTYGDVLYTVVEFAALV